MKRAAALIFALRARAGRVQHARPAATPRRQQAQGTEIGIDPAWMDKSVKPGDDFFSYANGTWVKNTQIPADRSRIGGFYIADQEREKNTRELFDDILKSNPTSGNDALIANYYKAYLNTDAIDRAGLAPAKADLDAIAAIADKRAAERGDRRHAPRRHRSAQRDQLPHRESVRHLRHAGPGDAGRAAALSDAGRHRPARARILSVRRPQDGRASRTKYQRLCRDRSCSSPAIPTRRAPRGRIIDLETKIAKAHETREESEDFAKGAQVWTRAELEQKAPGIDWGALLDAAQLGSAQKFDAYHFARDPEARRAGRLGAAAELEGLAGLPHAEPAGERAAQAVPRRELRLLRHGARRARRSSGRATSWRSTRPATRCRTRSARPMSTNISRPRPRPRSRTWSTTSRPRSPSASRRSTGWRRRPSRKR